MTVTPFSFSPCRRARAISALVGASVLLAVVTPATRASEQAWTFLPIEDIGARTFLEDHPTYDGRGVIVAVLDTGVDMTVAGLDRLPDGGTKVIGARDFSGEGTIDLERADIEDGRLRVDEDLVLEGFDALTVRPAADHLVWSGVFDEARFLNSGVQDLDDDGAQDDRFGVVVFAADRAAVRETMGEGRGVALRRSWNANAAAIEDAAAREPHEWVVLIDTDRDGHVDDETPLRDYATDWQSFTLRRSMREDARDRIGLAVDLRGDREPELSLHYDGGGHGSHVAGIASGFGVHGQPGLNGVAPGAWIVSCKIGDSSLSGGATVTESMKKAYEYVGDLQQRTGMPVVVNMSYGIGSETEGDAAMDRWLDEWLDEHTSIVVCHSASNSGPGLSNVGLPAAADGVIASAAMISREMARDLYGGAFVKDELFGFSSRGGELAKPDVAAPGGASSTVPLFETGDRYNGTSMASPHTAGAVACILSGLVQTDRGWNFGTIKRALQATANPMPGYTRIDAGAGVVDLPAAFVAAAAHADAGEAGLVTIYTVRTEAPGQPDGEAPAAYWRAGGWFPAAPEQQEFVVTPRFDADASEDARAKFYRAVRLTTDTPWIRIDRRETYLRGPGERTIALSYDADALTEPGVHVGTVRALAKDAGRKGAAALEFELVVTIVVPQTFDDDAAIEWENARLDPGAFARRFVRVPPDASSFTSTLRIPDGAEGNLRFVLHDPDGRRVHRSSFAASTGEREVVHTISGGDLVPGVWEIDVRADFAFAARSVYDLEARIDRFSVRPDVIEGLAFESPGVDPRLRVEVVPTGSRPFRGRAAGAIDHWVRERTIDVRNASTTEVAFTVDENVSAVEFDVVLDAATYGLMTDCAINVADADGRFVVQAGLDQRRDTVRLSDPAPGKYTLQIEAGFAHARSEAAWSLELVERAYLARPVHLQGTAHGDAALRLVPDVAVELEFVADGVPPLAPAGWANAGEVRLIESGADRIALRVPVRLVD